MPNRFYCDECRKRGENAWLQIDTAQSGPSIELSAILTCSKDSHQWPLVMLQNDIVSTQPRFEAAQSYRLEKRLPKGIKEDVQEAERAHAGRNYKACLVMCRRAIQLALEQGLGKEGLTLGPLMEEERKHPVMNEDTYQLTVRIKKYGDGGAHRVERINPKTVEVIIHDTVDVLNELCQKVPALQSMPDSNAQ